MKEQKRYKCIIWGISDEYESVINQIKTEELHGNLKVVALVCRKEDRYALKHDGYPVILKEDLKFIDFDLLIIANNRRFDEIERDFRTIKYDWNGIVCRAKSFLIPNFDFQLYINLMQNPVTLISNDAWGSLLYRRMGLNFSSPFIDTYIEAKDYVKIFNDPLFYLNQELYFYEKGNCAGQDLLGAIGEQDKIIKIHFLNYSNFEDAKSAWDRRCKRVNIKRLFLKANCFKMDNVDLSLFNNSRFPHLIFTDFYTYDASRNDVFVCRRPIPSHFTYLSNEARVQSYSYFEINYLKLLNGIKNFSRTF